MIDFSDQGLGVEIQCIGFERAASRLALLLVAMRLGVPFLRSALRRLGNAVRNEIHHVEPRRPLLVQVIHGVRILLAENCDQNVGAGDVFLA